VERPDTQDALDSQRPLEAWLVSELAGRMGVQPERIEVDEPFAAYGLGSAESIAMVGDLEVALDMKLSGTLLWEYPTIAALAGHLARVVPAPAIRGLTARA
jgi:acyl carrier protein